MLKYSLKIFLLLSSLFSVSALADTPTPKLVLDTADTTDLPKNFRTTLHVPPQLQAEQISLNDLHAIASAQFSAQSLSTVLYHIRLQAPLVVVDLREESHGFVNGNAVSWYSLRNWANLGKTPIAIAQQEKQLLANLAKKDSVTLNKILSKSSEGTVTSISPLTITVKNVQTEQELVGMHSLGYVRFYVADGWPPDDSQVDLFVEWARYLPANTWVYFHSGGGEGRTAMFMAMYDMFHNAKIASFDDIMKRQVVLGSMDLAVINKDEPYKNPLAKRRLAFLKQFYKYCQVNQDNYKTPWSTWNSKYSTNILRKLLQH